MAVAPNKLVPPPAPAAPSAAGANEAAIAAAQDDTLAALGMTPWVCSPTITIISKMPVADRTAACNSMTGQDAFFFNLMGTSTPVAGDNTVGLEVTVFENRDKYQQYAGSIYGVPVNNGGVYLEASDPSVPGSKDRFVAYQDANFETQPHHVWNLNHEYTHYLDGRFDKYGPDHQDDSTIWWTEGLAEYVAFSYLNKANTAATGLAGNHTWKLSQLFDTTYGDSDKVYKWGYLAVRYMMQSHRADVDALLGYWRAGDYTGASTYLHNTVGTKYDSDWDAWLTACAAGNCGTTPVTSPTPTPPAVSECTASDVRALGKNCKRSNLSGTAGALSYFWFDIPAGTPQLT
ncbi:collagenase, partial [Streptomyces sp. NPDC020800]|uniref:collagenase n=1 Tax=Streptomyces sp. NPDC020800 TaxID=3365092 RepID=UPI00379ABAF8